MTAFGQDGPRGNQTAYDHAIQATSGITAATGTLESGPIKTGVPVIDYATGTMGAFAVSAALYQTLRTGKGQYIDMAMLDVALILQSSHITDYFHTGKHHKRAGNKMRFPESSMHEASDGLLQLAASNRRQHRRFYNAIGEAAEAERTSLDERNARYDEKHAMIAAKIKQKTAQEWEDYLQSKHVPATRVRETHETLAGPAAEAPPRAAHARERARRRQAGDRAARRVQVRPRRPVDRAAARAARRAHRLGARGGRLQRGGDRGAAQGEGGCVVD